MPDWRGGKWEGHQQHGHPRTGGHDVADVVVDDGDAAASAASRHPRPASQEGGGGRSSACTQTQAEGVCEAEVQTDIEDVSAIRSVSYPQSPADGELVNHLLIN